ncbi:MAG: DUF4834 family protein [Bacteroidota bacterium]
MISFLKTVLIILLVYLGLKFLFRLAAPYLMRFVAKKAAQRFESAFGQHPFHQSPQNHPGEVTIDKTPGNPKTNGKIVGEYVDFEELE